MIGKDTFRFDFYHKADGMILTKGNINGISDMHYREEGKRYSIQPDTSLAKLKEKEDEKMEQGQENKCRA